MGYIKINQDKLSAKTAQELIELCPFNAFDYTDAYLSINAACKLCKICVKNGPDGVCEFIEDDRPSIDKNKYKGIVVYVEHYQGKPHPVAWELVGKAKELARITKEHVSCLVIGDKTEDIVQEALSYGVDHVHVYDDPAFHDFNVETYTQVVADFQTRQQANILLFGGTMQGRSFAPRVAAKLKTGLTADCTKLDIREDGDLLQIRPAFGGNIMAKIHTPNHRPQLATIRYKMFDAPTKQNPHGTIHHHHLDKPLAASSIRLVESLPKADIEDISDADVIIAVGRGFKKEKDLELIEPLRKKLNATLACTRPLIENGWFDARKQIGLSGRTVKPKLIINIGISGAVQYIEGMKDAELIISVNSDPDNRLFEISHHNIIGDLYDVIPELNRLIDTLT